MKIKLSLSALLILALGVAATAQSQNQSLGDYARAVKKTKPDASTRAPKIFDNDNLPADGSVSVVGKPTSGDSDASKDQNQPTNNSAESTSADAKKTDAKSDKSDKKDEPQLKPGQSMEERDAALGALKKRLDEQKKKVDLLSRELDVLKREYQLKAANFYNDAARRVLNPNGLYDDNKKYQEQIDEKQKALDAANAELSDMQAQARKNGAPESALE